MIPEEEKLKIEGKSMMLALMKSSATSDGGKSIISVHSDHYKDAAQEYIAKGFIVEIGERSTDLEDERCYALTARGVEVFNERDFPELFTL